MAYHVVLEPFEGPLDLLLYLISNAQIDIRDINISEITDQYLSYMSLVRDMDMDRSSQFLAMAARLLEIKSKRLLPRARVDEETTADQDEQMLIVQLEAYRQYKLACDQLRDREKEAGLLFFKKPDEMYADSDYSFDNASAAMLFEVFRRMMDLRGRDGEEGAEEAQQAIERDSFTIQERIFFIRSRIASRGQVGFSELFTEKPGREEVVVTFIALLELLRLNRIWVIQKRFGDEIMIRDRNSETQRAKDENGEGNP